VVFAVPRFPGILVAPRIAPDRGGLPLALASLLALQHIYNQVSPESATRLHRDLGHTGSEALERAHRSAGASTSDPPRSLAYGPLSGSGGPSGRQATNAKRHPLRVERVPECRTDTT
jgi:hypothetical protein